LNWATHHGLVPLAFHERRCRLLERTGSDGPIVS
jgi:hypothetical protein